MPSARRLLRALVVTSVAAGLIVPGTVAYAAPSPAEIQQQITKSSTELEGVVEQYNKLTEQLKQTKSAIADLTAKLGPLQQRVNAAQADVAEIAARAYKTGDLSAVNALLSSGSAEGLLGRIGYLDRLAHDRQKTITAYSSTEARFTAERDRLAGVQARQDAQIKQLATRKASIEKEIKRLGDLRRKLYGSATESGSRYTGSIPKIAGSAGVAVTYAYNAIGKPYGWAQDGPNSYDCSGLTMAAWRAAGHSLPHNAAMQWNTVAHIGRGSLLPGDLVFYNGLGHVALYVGSGKVIHAPTYGETVKLASVDMMPPYGYGRVR
ncbi:C40 family peptidase [Rhizomonospora bruguierae]|uniref:C40 family peptidase n=1 Tax=Rhizomonospora bruguierae TaxID=1581705 RepID=UPI001BCE2D74|nr:C40 family peptidase [Micromonospora sp. NBRC 107566]